MKDAWGRTIEYVRLSLTDACNFVVPTAGLQKLRLKVKRNYCLLMNG